jgi:hypothetical protein
MGIDGTPAQAEGEMRTAKKIVTGQRFLATDLRVGSAASLGAWEVTQTFEGGDGFAYARLANTLDRSRVKTVAEGALLDRHLFHRVA